MEFQDSLKALRQELGLTQQQLAARLNVSTLTVTRWETGRAAPQTRKMAALVKLAEEGGASAHCVARLQSTQEQRRKSVLRVPKSSLFPVDRATICRLVDDSYNAVYVADLESDELLYANHQAEREFGQRFVPNSGQKCYAFVAGRPSPCPYCSKGRMSESGFSDARLEGPNGRIYRIRGKKLDWNGQKAHVQYLSDVTRTMEAPDAMTQLVDFSGVGLAECRMDGSGATEMTYLSQGLYALLGDALRRQVRSTGFVSLENIAPGDRNETERRVKTAFAAQADFRLDLHTDGPAGEARHLFVRGRCRGRREGWTLYVCTVCDADEGTQSGRGTEQ